MSGASRGAKSTAGTLRRPITSERKLNKLIPKNPKYKKVKAVTRTGTHAGNVKKKLNTKGEIFKRMGRDTLRKHIEEYECKEENVADLTDSFSKMATVVTVGEDAQTNLTQMNYLLLDLREEEAFESCRIIGAVHFPVVKIRRDQWGSKLYAYKNKEGKSIIIYDETESKTGSEAATTMTQKGFDNVFLLTGGLKRFAKRHSDLVVGDNQYEGMADSVLPSRIASTFVSRQVSRAGSIAPSRTTSKVPSPKNSSRKMKKRF
mmetsp:Transcript_23779/g.38168  ORF Transcript_23779/g.38168 Transcript_23779/m.38168 type:complete len:261 (-) Transcript_23779:203-985(-)|eukprot:jgi/Bigna1/87777/estExt_fgenesh1_pg.C_240055